LGQGCLLGERSLGPPGRFKTYRRRWFLLAVVCLLNCSNAMVSAAGSPAADSRSRSRPGSGTSSGVWGRGRRQPRVPEQRAEAQAGRAHCPPRRAAGLQSSSARCCCCCCGGKTEWCGSPEPKPPPVSS
uniref:Uncharacterized protein n=1 Tax=Catharus ustulatus TaxID=91951 RepID=A0A8C3UWZ7_CATUS